MSGAFREGKTEKQISVAFVLRFFFKRNFKDKFWNLGFKNNNINIDALEKI
jgi:hypothetical protein